MADLNLKIKHCAKCGKLFYSTNNRVRNCSSCTNVDKENKNNVGMVLVNPTEDEINEANYEQVIAKEKVNKSKDKK